MSDLKQLSEHVFYLAGGVNCCILKNDDKAILIDTGQDKNYGRNIRKACESLNVTPIAIINTHAHADHYGGNDYLLRQFDIPVYAPAFETSIMQSPYLEPVYLFNGAKPLPELMSKWLLAKPSRVDHELSAGQLQVADLDLSIIDTSGHAHKQCSIICDDVLIAADALFGESVLSKYLLPFGQDIALQIESASKLKEFDISTTLPGHGEPSEDLNALADVNLEAFHKASDTVLKACNGSSTEEVLVETCNQLELTMTDIPRYYLNLCVVNAYLSYLRESGQVTLEIQGNKVVWLAV